MRSARNSSSISPFIIGAALGAVGAYLFDPDRGRKRRAMVRDQLTHYQHELERLGTDGAESLLRDASNRLEGLWADAAKLLSGQETARGRVLIDRVYPEDWPDSIRTGVGALGAALLLNGLRRRTGLSLALSACGLGALTRASINRELSSLAGDVFEAGRSLFPGVNDQIH